MSSHPKDTYATISTPGTKKVSVGARRVGSRDRMAIIAVCSNENDAEKIVDALNSLQGKLDKLEAPAQRVLVEVREALNNERVANTAMRSKVRELESQLRDKSNEIGRLNLALSTAQKVARETA